MPGITPRFYPVGILLILAGAAIIVLRSEKEQQGTPSARPTHQTQADQTAAVVAEPLPATVDPVVNPDASTNSVVLQPTETTQVQMPPFPLGADMPANKRISAAKDLPRNLPLDQQQEILAFLPHITRLTDMTPGTRHLLAEILFENLRLQQPPVSGFPAVLQDIYRDEDTDIIIRGYAVQHIGAWQLDQPHDPEVETMLWEAAGMAEKPFAGMSLIALDRLVNAGQPVDSSRLDATALAIAENPSSDVAARMCALDVGARRGSRQFLPAARQLGDDAQPLYIRLAAIHAIGKLGDEEDIQTLSRWSQDDGSRCQVAAAKALQTLQQRTAQ